MTNTPAEVLTPTDAVRRTRRSWRHDIGRDERAAILAWGSFTATFAGVRALTHWIKDGHGPKGGGVSLGGEHFHHYNLGILGLSIIGSFAVRAEANKEMGELAAIPVGYGVANALIADEAALLLDLKDVYWAPQGKRSVDLAVGTIGLGGLAIALTPLVKAVRSA